jgi:DNA (cytosine-5)-methyltransferase 1
MDALVRSECCVITHSGIEFTRQPTQEEYFDLVGKVRDAGKAWMWMVGDLTLVGESSGYLERGKLQQVAELFGIAYQTAAQAVSVCRAFESCRRLQHLTFGHHHSVANRPDAPELLEWAAERKASVQELRQEKKRRDATQTQVSREQMAASIDAVNRLESLESIEQVRPQGDLRELALFAGAGGGILGGVLAGWRTICAVERDHYAACVLAMRQNDGSLRPFPIWDDVTTFDGTRWRGRVDVVSGGFPCQDISINGNGDGIDGERSGLWKEMARIIREVRPRFVFVENSPALTSRGLGIVLGDLAEMGFYARWGCVSAQDVGAPHKRERIWIAADSEMPRCEEDVPIRNGKKVSMPGGHRDVRRPAEWWRDQSRVQRVGDGVANRVERLTAIGNGQVPAVAANAWSLLSGGAK